MTHKLITYACTIGLLLLSSATSAQELNCKVKINHAQVQTTNTSVFETLERVISEFMNNRAWTDLQFGKDERIDCSLNITIRQYKPADNAFTGELLYQLTRPVYGSSYSSTTFSMRDQAFNFQYIENEPLEFNENSMDNNLTALLAYYAYLFIGLDLDTFSPLGGTDVLHRVETIVANAQNIAESGWKAFDDEKNRHAIITDYMESSMEPMRRMMYQYHRLGLDQMSANADRGRTAVTEALELLKEAHDSKPMSQLPQIFTDYKRDELVNIYKGHGTQNERQQVHDFLLDLNPAQNTEWKKLEK